MKKLKPTLLFNILLISFFFQKVNSQEKIIWEYYPTEEISYAKLAKILCIEEELLRKENQWWTNNIIPTNLPKALKIPLSAEAPSVLNNQLSSSNSTYQYHTVTKGDNLYRLAEKYNVSVKQLQAWNKIGNDYKIYLGQSIIVGVSKVKEIEKEQDRQLTSIPSKIKFADITFYIPKKLQSKIAKEVDYLKQNDFYFQKLLELSKIHLTIVEECLAQHQIPKVFTYLPIMESNFKAEALSSSGALGYWQFKAPAALEMGLRLDSKIDERLNLTASSYAASKYLKRSHYLTGNWFFALLSYNLGLSGAKAYFAKNYPDIPFREKHWKLRIDSPRYLIKFLAYQIAFQEEIKKPPFPNLKLFNYTAGNNKTLEQIAQKVNIDFAELKYYNSWLKTYKIPTDKTYYVIIPLHKY